MHWIDLAQARALVNAVINERVPQYTEIWSTQEMLASQKGPAPWSWLITAGYTPVHEQ